MKNSRHKPKTASNDSEFAFSIPTFVRESRTYSLKYELKKGVGGFLFFGRRIFLFLLEVSWEQKQQIGNLGEIRSFETI